MYDHPDHDDQTADIAWLRFEAYDPAAVVAEEVEAGLRELDRGTGETVGLEYWQASATLPADLLSRLAAMQRTDPRPGLAVQGRPRQGDSQATVPGS